MISNTVRLAVIAGVVSMSVCSFAGVGARELMQEVLDRYDGETRVSTLSLVTCAYMVKDARISCTSTPRKKTMQQVVKDYGENLKDSRGFTLILEPVAENGIGILQYDYEDRDKDADQWLYLPEIGQVKRVASSSDAPKKGSLFGSEFSLEDIETLKIEDYQYSSLGETVWKDRPITKIEQTPTKARARKSNYSKQIHWVDTERLLIMKTEYYGWNGGLVKVSVSDDVEKVSGIWTVKKLVMRNLETQRISVMQMRDVRYNQYVSDDMLTKRILSDRVFRESKLRSIRMAMSG